MAAYEGSIVKVWRVGLVRPLFAQAQALENRHKGWPDPGWVLLAPARRSGEAVLQAQACGRGWSGLRR